MLNKGWLEGWGEIRGRLFELAFDFGREPFHKVVFYKKGFMQVIKKLNCIYTELSPVDGLGQGVMINNTDFEQINMRRCQLDNSKGLLRVYYWFKACPSKNASLVKLSQCINALVWHCRVWFPEKRSRVAGKSESGGKGVSISEKVNISKCPISTFRKCLERYVVSFEDLQSLTGQLTFYINVLVRICGKAQEYALIGSGKILGFLLNAFDDSVSWFAIQKHLSLFEGTTWSVAISTAVIAACVKITSKSRIFPRSSSWLIDGVHYYLRVDYA